MIFDPAMADLVVRGKKTVTRRPANGKPCGHRVGSIQKVQPGQGQPAAPGRILIKSVQLEQLRDVTHADARREGYGGTDPRGDFLFSFWGRYGYDAGEPVSVYRIEFEYVPAS